MSAKPLKLGVIGLDTSHVTAFAEILNDPGHPHHIPGATIQVAYPGKPSPDFALSCDRIEGYTEELVSNYHIRLADSEEAVAEECDAILLESVDGRVHPEQFKRIVPYGKPVFIDKPFALSSREAREMLDAAERFRVPWMSCSSLRYGEALSEQLRSMESESIIGADCHGPMAIEPTQPGLFWYGIHAVEMLYKVLGRGCVSVSAAKSEDYDQITAIWDDGRMGTIRGNRKGNNKFGVLLHGDQTTRYANMSDHHKPFYASMLEQIVRMFHTGIVDIDPEETLEIIRFIESANLSRETGRTIRLQAPHE
ncbi:oxidoreductase [Paenibacillus stellifer]|uniref:Oxidoreductase n=1 Tax=Paenibacillus stellifer TaxID=169760 RepID=A0A089N837_9BACL|nr:Gfo/Idh/MocA family oxidoreductase [Paenibacillus stellifer]AIQ64914.1 oxidoreductase [Paenibacillus stellifer]